jgi:probable HAF family extracellular repeat protein
MGARQRLAFTGVLPLLLAACLSDGPSEPTGPPTASLAAAGYAAADLGTLGGTWSEAYGINHSGQIVGQSTTANGALHAFLWSGGVMTDLGTLDATYQFTTALAINRAGKIVGYSQSASGMEHAFAWKLGVLTDLGLYPGWTSSFATDVNRSGYVLGSHGFLWKAGSWRSLQPLVFTTALNDSTWVVGGDHVYYGTDGSSYSRAMLLKKGAVRYLAKLAGDKNSSVPLDINNAGQMVGQCQNARAKWRAVRWDKFGKITNLGTLGGRHSYATAINDAGHVVGRSRTAANELRAFLWRQGVMTDLGTLGGHDSRAEDINDAGVIVGSSARSDGTVHATAWRPQ